MAQFRGNTKRTLKLVVPKRKKKTKGKETKEKKGGKEGKKPKEKMKERGGKKEKIKVSQHDERGAMQFQAQAGAQGKKTSGAPN